MNFLKKHKNDILLILAVLIAAGGLWLYTAFGRSVGAEVLVSVDGEEVYRLPISEDARLTVGEGERFNTFVISGGEVWMEDAGCPDHVCVESGKVSLDGETIVCLPNKTIITVLGGENSGLDGVAG